MPSIRRWFHRPTSSSDSTTFLSDSTPDSTPALPHSPFFARSPAFGSEGFPPLHSPTLPGFRRYHSGVDSIVEGVRPGESEELQAERDGTFVPHAPPVFTPPGRSHQGSHSFTPNMMQPESISLSRAPAVLNVSGRGLAVSEWVQFM